MKSFVHAKLPLTHHFLWIAAFLQLGQLASQAYTYKYLFTGTETNITLSPGIYDITVYGAQGGTAGSGAGGLGAKMQASFSFSGLTTLTLLVGGVGAKNPPQGAGAGGGGGSYVVNGNVPLVVAGGGGGGDYGSAHGGSGLTGINGSGGGGRNGGIGGTNGTGGATSAANYGGGGGGGYLTGGVGVNSFCGFPGGSFVGGGSGGSGNFYGGNGGYGGGGGGGYEGGGGGGGYSGGGGSGWQDGGGGGGGSYINTNAITITDEVPGIASPDGSPNGEIIISAVSIVRPVISIGFVSNAIILNWSDPTFLLQTAPNISVVFTNVPGARSPYTNSITRPQQYFRLVK